MMRMGCVKSIDAKNAAVARRSSKKRESWRGTAPVVCLQHSITAQFSFTQLGKGFTAAHLLRELVPRRSKRKARTTESSSNVRSPQLYFSHLHGRRQQKRRPAYPDRNKLYGYRTFEGWFVLEHSAEHRGFRRDLHDDALSRGPGHRLRYLCAR
jgi:hypothetical protein